MIIDCKRGFIHFSDIFASAHNRDRKLELFQFPDNLLVHSLAGRSIFLQEKIKERGFCDLGLFFEFRVPRGLRRCRLRHVRYVQSQDSRRLDHPIGN